jgi:TonB family protein
VRSLLWFHPAVWWLIGRIRLTREQVVDQAAIRLTDSRERYVEALLTVARASSPAALTPASAFLRRRLLKRRVARILQETTMTTRRLIASLTASAAALVLAATFAVRSFPLEAQGQPAADPGAPIQIVKGGEQLLHGDLPEYPRRAIAQKVEGDVVVSVTLNDRGEVADARVLSGPEELRRAALEAVLRWHYSPSAIHSTVIEATLRFRLPSPDIDKFEAELREKIELKEKIKGPHNSENVLIEIEKALEDPATTKEQRVELEAKYVEMGKVIGKIGKYYTVTRLESENLEEPKIERTWRLGRVRAEGVSEATAMAVLAQAGLAVGDVITREAEERLQKIARDMDEHFELALRGNEDAGLLTIIIRAR